ncbi:MAG TPA: CAP domain-containing protein [Nakamurella sp.]|nr:CAP domain-containing protein [Nakamurella sp.]
MDHSRAGAVRRAVTAGVAALTLAGGSVLGAPSVAAGTHPQVGPRAEAVGAHLQAATGLSRMATFDQQLISLVNQARAKAGVPAVREATGLTKLSVWWSTKMARGDTGFQLQHNPNAWTMLLNYGAANRTAWGENVASFSTAATASALFNAYMNSPGHRANILSTKYRYIGMGTVAGSHGAYNTMEFTDRVESGQVVAAAPTGPSRGKLLARNGSSPVPGVRVDIRNGTCSKTLSSMVTGSDGSFPVVAYPGKYCAVPRSVPPGYRSSGAVQFSVTAGTSFTAALSLSSAPIHGRLVARYGSDRLAGVRVDIRNGSCSKTFSSMVTGSDGSFPVVAYPGSYCAVPRSVPAGYRSSGAVQFQVTAGSSFSPSVALSAAPSHGKLVALDGSGPVAGVRVDVRDASCSRTYSSMVTGSDGSFPIVAYPATYCAVPRAVPSGYRVPAAVTFDVDPGDHFTATVPVR